MKYKDMVHKGSVVPKSDYKVVVGDTAEKIKMEEEITTLKGSQASFDVLKKENEELQEQVKFLKDLSSEQQASMYELGKNFSAEVTNLADYAVLKEKFDRLSKDFIDMEDSYREANKDKASLKTELDRKHNNDNLSNLTIEKLQAELTSLGGIEKNWMGQKIDLENRIEHLEGTALTLKNTIDSQESELVVAAKSKADLDREYNKLAANHQAVKQTNKTAISKAKRLERERENVDKEFLKVTNIAKEATSKLKETTQDLETAYKQYNELRKDTEFLWTKMRHLQQEASKPRYTSLSSIERSEGFKLPRNLVAPKNFLGHGKPTLLKVSASK